MMLCGRRCEVWGGDECGDHFGAVPAVHLRVAGLSQQPEPSGQVRSGTHSMYRWHDEDPVETYYNIYIHRDVWVGKLQGC